MERWQWAAEQRRNTTKCDFTITTGAATLGLFFFSSRLGRISVTPLLSLSGLLSLAPTVLCNCSVVTACLSRCSLLVARCVPFSSLGTTTSSSAVCLSVCPSLPAPLLLLLDGYHRLFSRGASRFFFINLPSATERVRLVHASLLFHPEA